MILLLCLVSPAQTGPPEIRFDRTICREEKGRSLKDPMSLDVDRTSGSGEVLVADTGNDALVIFTKEGAVRAEIGKAADLRAPIGAAFERSGEILVAEMDSPVLKILDVKGGVAEKIDLSSLAKGINPGRLCLDGDGNLYVVDRANERILVLDPKRKLVVTSEEESRFRMGQDVAVDRAGDFFVAAARGTALHRFDARGKFVSSFGDHGYGPAEFSFPSGVAVDARGRIWIADSLRHELKVFDATGRFLASFGGPGTGPGRFDLPVDLAFDAKGKLFVLEKGGNRVQVFEVTERK